MTNSPEIKTCRLILRRFEPEDVEDFLEIMKDKEVNKFLPLFPIETIENAKKYLTNHYLKTYEKPTGFRYAICQKSDNRPIGYINIADNDSYDLGFGLRKDFWSKGMITEACQALIEKIQLTEVPYLTATHDINNAASGRVMQKIGMKYCYSYEELWQPKNILVTFRMYQLNLKTEQGYVYMKYWEKYPKHEIEENI